MSNLVVQGFEKVVLKSVNVIQKEGKRPLVFVNFMDYNSFVDTSDLMFLGDVDLDSLTTLKTLEKKPVKAVIVPNTYNGKTSFVAIDIKPA